MFKLKNKKINPGKTNKMIWAVTAGAALIFLLMGFLLFYEKKPADPTTRALKALSYLKEAEGIVDIQAVPFPLRVTVLYDPSHRKDFEKMIHFAAIRLAPQVDRCLLELAKHPSRQVVFRVLLEGGAIVSEERLQP